MKKIIKCFLTIGMVFLVSCTVDYEDSPNSNGIKKIDGKLYMNNLQYEMNFYLNDQWLSGRGTLGIAQYWAETEYTTENRYVLRTNQVDGLWEWPYRVMTDLKQIIDLNEDSETKNTQIRNGSNSDQIQLCRILMSYMFSQLTDVFGDVPYWSYGQKDNKSFKGLRLKEGVVAPAYTNAKDIYTDMLAELKDAADKLSSGGKIFASVDNIYGGDADKWKKFAHSLRLRLATHIRGVNPTLATTVYAESSPNAFDNNKDNATYIFGTTDKEASPWYDHFTVGARRDFAPADTFVDLLYNRIGAFSTLSISDPRLDKYFDKRGTTDVIGGLIGFGNAPSRYLDKIISWPAESIRKADYTQVLMAYDEVEFIRSEFNSWDAENYKKGVKASMARWGISAADATTYFEALPSTPNQEQVLTQKYIALYMNGLEAWTEYRRTGFPNTLVVPGTKKTFTLDNGGGDIKTFKDVEFKATDIDGTVLTEVMKRVQYPLNEQLLNNANWEKAKKELSSGDTKRSPLFWDNN